jgi:hypothetical protein
LLALLELLEAPESEGPVLLVDYPEDPPEVENDATVISCPVYYGDEVNTEGADSMEIAFLREIMAMRPWYDIAVTKRKRTTVGVSGIPLDDIGDFIYSFVKGEIPKNPRNDIELITTLKLAIDDLRAYYTEGATAQPGQENASSKSINDWFWNDTIAHKVLLALLDVCEKSPDETVKMMATYFVPTDVYAQYKGKAPH